MWAELRSAPTSAACPSSGRTSATPTGGELDLVSGRARFVTDSDPVCVLVRSPPTNLHYLRGFSERPEPWSGLSELETVFAHTGGHNSVARKNRGRTLSSWWFCVQPGSVHVSSLRAREGSLEGGLVLWVPVSERLQPSAGPSDPPTSSTPGCDLRQAPPLPAPTLQPGGGAKGEAAVGPLTFDLLSPSCFLP